MEGGTRFQFNIVLGIHIREGDMVFHLGGTRKRFSNLEKDIDFTFTCAEQIQKVIEKKYNTDKVIWFLAADYEKRKATVKQKYGSKVRFMSGPIEHVAHATRGNEDARHLSRFLDFFCCENLTSCSIHHHLLFPMQWIV